MTKKANCPELAGQVAAVTGGGGELCGAMVMALAESGVKVAVLDKDPARARARAEAVLDSGGDAMGLGADVLDPTSLAAAGAEIVARWGGLDILINGAGGNHPRATTSTEQSFFDLPVDGFRQVLELNFLGTVLPCQVLGKLILDRVNRDGGCGNIINISSMNAFRPLTRIPAYSAAKAAVSNFTQWLAVHMAQNYTPKIRVNAIAPGFFLTDQNRFLLMDQASGGFTSRGQTIIAHTPAGVLGAADDLISTLMWLLDSRSQLITGVVVAVDGGFSAFSGV